MNHAENPMSDSVNHPRTFEVLTAEPVRRRRKPRDWSDDDKARIVAAALQPGANVSAVARSEGLDPSQLYGWRRKALASGVVAPLTERTGKEIKFARVETVSSSAVEIVIGDVVVRLGDDFDTDHLVKVLQAVRKA
jgi:transposase